MEMAGEYPDIVIGCHGGGSNFAGLAVPVPARTRSAARGRHLRAIAVEPSACPTPDGRARGSTTSATRPGTTPLLMMHTLGHDVHAGAGARRRPALPRLGAAGQPPARGRTHRGRGLPPGRGLRERGQVRAVRGDDPGARVGARDPQRRAHALEARESGETKVILFNLSGHGVFDLAAYESFLDGQDGPERVERTGIWQRMFRRPTTFASATSGR